MRLPVSPRFPGTVEVSAVTRRFGDVTALRGVSFDLPGGTVAALVGPNGSGKTTLLRILAGLLAAGSGRVLVAGDVPGRGRASFVPAGDRGLYWRLTGIQNLEFFARISGLPRPRALEQARAVSAVLGADDLLARPVGILSTGQRRRLAIARGFAAGAGVVLLDEPYADLDEEGAGVVEALTRAWSSGGGSVLYAAPVLEGGPPAGIRLDLEEGSLRRRE
ncbi:MAG: ATP-binding cassette domain-containing protein [Actinomycetota bacterium]